MLPGRRGKAYEGCMCAGYARPQVHECARCGDTATCYGDTSGYLCTACALEEWDDLTTAEQLEKLGFERLGGVSIG